MKKIYLDYAAATPLDPTVLRAMEPYLNNHFHNPSALYLAARETRFALEEARASVAKSLGAKPAEIIFTAGATEANNLAIQGVGRLYPNCQILVSTIEHDSVIEPAKKFDSQRLPVNRQGLIDLDSLRQLLKPNTALISLIYVNNETGVVQSLNKVAQLIDKVRRQRLADGNGCPLYLHTDAAQAGNCLDLHVNRLGVDLMTINGGKIYGPKQSGALFIRAGVKIAPLIFGGGQENNLRSGTENLAATIGFAAALESAQTKHKDEYKRLQSLRALMKAQLGGLENLTFNESTKHQSPHLLNLTIEGIDGERLVMELDEAGIECATGSACSASNDEPSHVLLALRLSSTQASSSLRFSFGRATTEKDILYTSRKLKALLLANPVVDLRVSSSDP